MDTLLYLISGAYIIMVALTITSMYLRRKKHYILFKGLSSAGFTATAAVSALCHDRSLFIVMPFFILCFAGDILLALSDEIDIRLRDPQFTSGVAAFAVAHVFLIYEFGRMTCWHISPLWVVFSAGLLLYTIYTLTGHDFDYGGKALPCCVYAFIVGLCGGMGADIIISQHSDINGLMSGIGAISFMISDFILANKYFRIRKKQWYGVAILLFYYGAVLILALFFPA